MGGFGGLGVCSASGTLMKRGDSGPTAWRAVVEEKLRCHCRFAVHRVHIDRDAGGGIVCVLML